MPTFRPPSWLNPPLKSHVASAWHGIGWLFWRGEIDLTLFNLSAVQTLILGWICRWKKPLDHYKDGVDVVVCAVQRVGHPRAAKSGKRLEHVFIPLIFLIKPNLIVVRRVLSFGWW